MTPFRVMFLGDVVGQPGREIMRRLLPGMLAKRGIDFCIANAENAAGGSGVTRKLATELWSYGVDCLTTGDHVWRRREVIPFLGQTDRLLRAANFTSKAAGKGWAVLSSRRGTPVGVLNLLGRLFMPPIDCPFDAAEEALASMAPQAKIIVVDFHGEATSEKVAMGHFLDGRVSLVAGTHTHVPTADARLLPRGTAYVSDAGMTGAQLSVLGRSIQRVIESLTTHMPTRLEIAKEDPAIQGVIVDADAETGRATAIERFEQRDGSA